MLCEDQTASTEAAAIIGIASIEATMSGFTLGLMSTRSSRQPGLRNAACSLFGLYGPQPTWSTMRSAAGAASVLGAPGESAAGSSDVPLLRGVPDDRLGRLQPALLLHRLVDDREGRAVDIAAGALLHVELTVRPEQVALTDGMRWHTGASEALEDIEVD